MGKWEELGILKTWKYSINGTLRKAIRKAEVIHLAMKLEIPERRSIEELFNEYDCGTYMPNCPFYVSMSHEFKGRRTKWGECIGNKCFNKKTIGCHILPYAQRGLEILLRLEAWKRKLKFLRKSI